MNSHKIYKIGSFVYFKKMKRLLINIFYQIRYKYYQFNNLIKYFPHGKGEENRLKLIDSIDKLVNKTRIK